MPYNLEVLATFKGRLAAENMLPANADIGDMFIVNQTPWIWIQVPGTTQADWIDP
jgi:hypothetical protein